MSFFRSNYCIELMSLIRIYQLGISSHRCRSVHCAAFRICSLDLTSEVGIKIGGLSSLRHAKHDLKESTQNGEIRYSTGFRQIKQRKPKFNKINKKQRIKQQKY